MIRKFFHPLLLPLCVFALAACKPPGKPDPADAWIPPSKIADFMTLYVQSCAACHSIEPDVLAAAQPMNNPLYIQWAGRQHIHKVTAEGIPGTMMPVFLNKLGGELTKEQVDSVVDGIMKFADGAPPPPADLPAYAVGPGDVARGAEIARLACASCHGPDGAGGTGSTAAGSIVDPAYLGLVSNQSLKTAVVVGRTDLGMPDYRSVLQGRPLTNQDIDDLVAWMASHRINPAAPADAPPASNNPQPASP